MTFLQPWVLAALPLVALTLAEAYGCEPREIAEHTTRNARVFFGI